MNLLIAAAIPPNEVLGFFPIKSYVVIGFVVPTASPWVLILQRLRV